MAIEFFYHLLSLDFVWILQLILFNLHYSFAFLALAVILFGKNSFKMIFSVALLIFFEYVAYVEFGAVIGWAFLTGSFLLLFYVSRFLLLVFAEETPSLKNKLVPLMLVQFLVLFILYNLFAV